MPKGSLKLPISDVRGEPITGSLNVDFAPEKSANGGAGGVGMQTGSFSLDGATELTVSEIECLGGPGTLYRVEVRASNYRPFSFFQRIHGNKVNKAAENSIRLVANPKKVKDIAAPTFGKLPEKLRAFLTSAKPNAALPEDEDLAGLRGEGLYEKLGPLRKACLLNLHKKATHPTASGVFRFLEGQSLLVLRQDRFFSAIDPGVEDFLAKSDRFGSAPNKLHEPLRNFVLQNSFKSRDSHANLQVTLMRNLSTGETAADIDIDESMGIAHGFEVIKNSFRGRTNPYLVRELMILSDATERTLDPDYGFVF